MSLRTKRNFRGLALADPDAVPPPAPIAGAAGATITQPASRPLPVPGAPPAGKRRPPALLDDGPAPLPRPTLPLADDPYKSYAYPEDAPVSAMEATLSQKLEQLKMGVKLDLKNEDFKKLSDLGHGNGGSVEKVEHLPTGTIMAKKVVLIEAKQSVKKQILRELDIMHECHSEYIISSFGSFLAEPNICICMEYMDRGSFDGIYKKYGPLPVEVVGLVALSVLEGLTYLYDAHRIMHRDIKPSNILFNSEGQIKLCDFGVSGELVNSIAQTFVGTSVYMSPERLQGAQYSVKSDVWSLGITLVELAVGAFPFTDPPDDDDDSDLEEYRSAQRTPTHRDSFAGPNTAAAKVASRRKSRIPLNPDGGLSILELMSHIINEPSPRLPDGDYPPDAEDLVDACLLKNPEHRPPPKELLQTRWIKQLRTSEFAIKEWAAIL